MTAYPTWTPAPRPGIIPLHPLGFGTILGRSFAALRQNPRVLLGFALVVQVVTTLVVTGVIVATTTWAYTRVATLDPGTDEFETVMAGSIALIGITTLVLSVAAGALGVIVQGVVVSEVAHAAIAEKLTLRRLWQRVRPVAWRLVGYSVLVMVAVALGVGVVVALVIAIGQTVIAAAIVIAVLAVLAAIPLSLWIAVKLLLVPAAIILERATIRSAIARSWRLTRGRFWSTLGILVIVSLSFGALAQVVSLPFTLLSFGLSSVFAPTGDPDTGALIGVVIGGLATQVLTILIQAVALIVQATATGLVYIDCRMRHEGLDLDLLAYVEQRDAGRGDLPDPYLQGIGRDTTARWATPAYTAAPPFGMPPYAAPATPYAPPAAPYAPPTAPPTADAPAPPAAPPSSPTVWTPPGGDAEGR